MATLHFELVSPEKLVFSGDVEQVDVPGAEGDFGVLAGHAPMVTTLRPGILTVTAQAASRRSWCSAASPKCRPKGSPCWRMSPRRSRTSIATCSPRASPRWRRRIEGMQPGNELDKLITRLDHFKDVDRHLTGTAMH